MGDNLKGLIITTIGVLLVVPDSLFVRLIHAEPMVTAFWRSITSGFLILCFIILFQGLNGFRVLLKTRWYGLLYIVLIGTTAPAFVMAVTYTSVANVVFIFASMPVFAALFSRILLGEHIHKRMVLTMSAVIFGLAIIAYGSGFSQIASWKGDLWALYVSGAFAAALTTVRLVKSTSMIPALPFAYLGGAIIMSLFTEPLNAFFIQWPIILGHGLFIGGASCLLAIGPRYIKSAEVSLLILLESVLAPILVWAVIGEDPGYWTIIGGLVVITSLIFSNLYVLAEQKLS